MHIYAFDDVQFHSSPTVRMLRTRPSEVPAEALQKLRASARVRAALDSAASAGARSCPQLADPAAIGVLWEC